MPRNAPRLPSVPTADAPAGRLQTRRPRPLRSAVLAIAVGLGAAGCATSVEPWVAPYDRDLLADPLMRFDRDPLAAAYRRQLFGHREAARGAEGGTGGGCGCD